MKVLRNGSVGLMLLGATMWFVAHRTRLAIEAAMGAAEAALDMEWDDSPLPAYGGGAGGVLTATDPVSAMRRARAEAVLRNAQLRAQGPQR
jgi:hypothetical protein